MELKYLVEEQNAAFDEEYHSAAELRSKVELLRKQFGNDGPRSIPDLGGGNGIFLDALLAEFPKARNH